VDPYIDNHEAVLYGRYFYRCAEPLLGASQVFNVEALRQLVLIKAEAVAAGMTGADTPKSEVRTGRDAVEESNEELLDRLRRFYHYLQSLPASASVDVGAFFANGKLGKISKHKAEDMLSRAETVMRGFTTPTSAGVPNGAEWQADILLARTRLNDALNGKLGASNTASTSGGSLAQAREEFLHVYNKVAKRAIRGLLAELGREDELRLYFRDMQVNEDRTRPAGTPAEPGTEPAGEPAGDDDPSEIAP
jgi:hypothetical protein